jgi:hypothetical protein
MRLVGPISITQDTRVSENDFKSKNQLQFLNQSSTVSLLGDKVTKASQTRWPCQ